MKKHVIVVFGGESWEREGSIVSACEVARSLDRQGISNKLVEFPLKEHHISENHSSEIVVFNAMHGKNGEDGTLSKICEMMGLPYNFSRAFAHQISFDKLRFKSFAHSMNIKTAPVLPRLYADRANFDLPLPISKMTSNKPYIIKSVFGGGSRGINVILPGTSMENTIKKRDKKYEPYFIEEFIDGRFITCAITGEKIDASLPLMEVRFKGHIYDYEIKHNQALREEILAPSLPSGTEKIIRNVAKKMFQASGADPIVRFDFMVSTKDKYPYLLEANTVPGMSQAGNMASIWKKSGRTYDELIAYLLTKAH